MGSTGSTTPTAPIPMHRKPTKSHTIRKGFFFQSFINPFLSHPEIFRFFHAADIILRKNRLAKTNPLTEQIYHVFKYVVNNNSQNLCVFDIFSHLKITLKRDRKSPSRGFPIPDQNTFILCNFSDNRLLLQFFDKFTRSVFLYILYIQPGNKVLPHIPEQIRHCCCTAPGEAHIRCTRTRPPL